MIKTHFYYSVLSDQQILRLEITMEYSALMAKQNSLVDLMQIAFHQRGFHHLTGLDLIDVLFEIHSEIFENEIQSKHKK